MKSLWFGSLMSLLVSAAALTAFAGGKTAASENAQVTLTISKFRSLSSLIDDGKSYVDATMSLDPHESVRAVDRDGMPTLLVKRAVDLEISIKSKDGEEYRPIGVYLKQDPLAQGDPDGKINFAHWFSRTGTLVLRHKFLTTGVNGKWEFFVLVQRVSDGAIGVIDPSIESESGE